MLIKGQQLRLHYEDFTTYIIYLNRTPQPQGCLSRDSNCVYTTRTLPSIYSNLKLDTTTTGMSIKGQQLRLHYEDYTTYIITLNWKPQPQECQSSDSNCVYTTRTSPSIYVSGSRKRDLMAQKKFLELLIQLSSTIFEI